MLLDDSQLCSARYAGMDFAWQGREMTGRAAPLTLMKPLSDQPKSWGSIFVGDLLRVIGDSQMETAGR